MELITDYNIGVPRDGVVRVYDSLYNCLATSTELQLAPIVNTSQPAGGLHAGSGGLHDVDE